MTRKPLPKAITRPIAELRDVSAGAITNETGRVLRSGLPPDAFEAEPVDVDFSRPVANDQFPGASIYDSRQAARRRLLARKIVDRHKTYAAVGGLFPLPIVNIAGVTAIIMRMVKQLSDLYGVPFERDVTRSAIVGLVGGAVPTGLGAATTSTLFFVVPGSALIGLAVSAISAGALTRGIGLVFLDHFENATMLLGAAQIDHA
jgi:uncharacterized protein (DUF697 family)